MKKPVIIIAIILAALGRGAAAYFWQNLWGARPAILPPPRDIAKLLEEPGRPEGKGALPSFLPLKLPPGFAISIFAGNVPGARVLALAGVWSLAALPLAVLMLGSLAAMLLLG